jgi:hypothetical protein
MVESGAEFLFPSVEFDVMQRAFWNVVSLTGLMCLLAAQAQAQTADGIGGRTDAEGPVSADEAAANIDDLLQLSEYQPRYYAFALRTSAVYTPAFLLNAFFSEHTNMWQSGVTNFSYGGQFTTRIPDKFDVTVGLDWTNMRTADGYWLESGDPVRDADWTESNLSLLGADVSLHWFNNLNRRQNLQSYYGFGLGLGIVLGEFSKYDVDVEQCGWTPEQRASENPDLLGECDNGFIPVNNPEDRIPPVLPSFSLTTGLRYLITDNVSMSAEIGWKSFYFYGGLNVGYYWFARQ